MANDMPFADPFGYPECVDAPRQKSQIIRAVALPRTLAQSRQIDREAGVPRLQPVRNPAPEPAARRHAVNEENCIAGATMLEMHLLSWRRQHATDSGAALLEDRCLDSQ
jgi:hypothetical protein